MTNIKRYSTIKTPILRKMLILADEHCIKQGHKIESLTRQLELMIKEKNKYKDKVYDYYSLKSNYDKLLKEKNKLARAYAKQLKIIK